MARRVGLKIFRLCPRLGPGPQAWSVFYVVFLTVIGEKKEMSVRPTWARTDADLK